MKKPRILLFCIVAIITGCKKADLLPPSIIGGWAWISANHGGVPGPLNPATPANSGIIQSFSFTDTHWYYSKNSVFVLSGTYSTSIVINNQGKSFNRIRFHDVNSQLDSVTYYTLSNDSLIFSNDHDRAGGSGSSVWLRAGL